jgi:hypothetical protein
MLSNPLRTKRRISASSAATWGHMPSIQAFEKAQKAKAKHEADEVEYKLLWVSSTF